VKKGKYILLILFIFNSSCEKEKIEQPDSDFTYPLSIGNRWEYSRELINYNIEPVELQAQIADTLSAFSTVEILDSAAIKDTIQTYKFRESYTGENKSNVSDVYCANGEDGFYVYAHAGGNYVAPLKSSAGKWIHFNGYKFYNVKELMRAITGKLIITSWHSDTLFYENPPLRSLIYPMKVGSQWEYRQKGNPWKYDKRIVKTEKIELPAGKFVCFVVQWLIDMNNDDVWDDKVVFYDYFSDVGLVKRLIILKDMQLMDTSGSIIGTYDSKDEYILLDYIVKAN